jgi:hypothetical protein
METRSCEALMEENRLDRRAIARRRRRARGKREELLDRPGRAGAGDL